MASSVIRADWFKSQAGWAGSAAPGLNSLRVVGASLVLEYDEVLTAGAVLVGNFTCLVATVGRTINAAVASGSKVTLTLATPVTAGQAVTLAYTAASAAKVADAAGVLAPAFAATTVVNATP